MNEAIIAAIREAVENGEEDVLTRAMAAVLRVHADLYGDADAIKLLLEGPRVAVRAISEANLDPNATDDDGTTPLHHAVGKGHGDVIEALRLVGVDVNAPDDDGCTPEHHPSEC